MKERIKSIYLKMTILVAMILLIIVTVSYGVFLSKRVQSTDNEILSSCFNVTRTSESASITLTKTIPLSDEEGLNTVPYTFTLTNSCDLDAEYYVIISSTNGSFSNNYVKYKYNSDIVRTLGGVPANTSNIDSGYNDSRIIAGGVLNHGDSAEGNIRLWLSDNANYNEIASSTWSGQVKIISKARS